MKGHLMKPRAVFAASLLAAVVAVTLVVLPAAAEGTAASHLTLSVVAVNPGVLPACAEDGSDCTLANEVRHFIYVRNTNSLPSQSEPSGPNRASFPNAFVVDRIDETVFVDGVETYDFFYTSPPDNSYPPYTGHWPATVACPPSGPPCNDVRNSAVMPGEKTAIFWTGWLHGNEEPNGLYVFKYTIRGSINGVPVELSDTTPPLRMTG